MVLTRVKRTSAGTVVGYWWDIEPPPARAGNPTRPTPLAFQVRHAYLPHNSTVPPAPILPHTRACTRTIAVPWNLCRCRRCHPAHVDNSPSCLSSSVFVQRRGRRACGSGPAFYQDRIPQPWYLRANVRAGPRARCRPILRLRVAAVSARGSAPCHVASHILHVHRR